jgi:hypothetical protein
MSPTFYEQLSSLEVILSFLFGLIFFWHNEIGRKAALKMLVKSTTVKDVFKFNFIVSWQNDLL